MVQYLPLSVSAAFGGLTGTGSLSGLTNLSGVVSGIGKYEDDALLAQIKKDLINSMNQDLVTRVEELEMTGEVGIILSFSDNSLISAYTESGTKKTYEEYQSTPAADRIVSEMKSQQATVLDRLWAQGLISEVKYQYCHIMNGAFVTTTYEQLDAICDVEGVGYIMISDTYEAAIAVDNPVNVYDTGIFNSSDISFTGKGTIVAILDTGCDYAHSAFTTHQVVDPLYDRDYVANLLPSTKAYELSGGNLETREVYYGNITGNKIVFGYDYADNQHN
jgi:subtilisin family serine protease